MSLLPNEVIAMQPLRPHSGPNVQRCCRREDRLRRDFHAVVEIVGRGDRSEEVVDDFEQAGLLEPNLAGGFAASE